MPTCQVCDEVITQPLCAACLERQVSCWLRERLPAQPELLRRLEELGEEVRHPGGATWCIRCHAPMSVCSYCYTQHIFAWIREAFPRLADEFLALFSLTLGHAGYERLPRRLVLA